MSDTNTYFGLPLDMCEIYRLLNLTHKYDPNKYSFSQSDYIFDYLKSKNVKMSIYSTDKGQYILGYTIPEIHDVWHNFCKADDLIDILFNLKKLFYEETIKLNICLQNVTLEHMEGEPTLVAEAKPVVIVW